MKILLVEDDSLLATGLKHALGRASYQVTHVADGQHADTALMAYEFDLVILDLGLPDIDGLRILKTIRGRKLATPVLVLTAREGVEHQVAALDAGGDDYMEKPFDLRELEARLRALLRRGNPSLGQEILLGKLSIDPFQRTVQIDGDLIDLPTREYEVLETLARNAMKVVSKMRIAQRLALNGEEVGDNAVEVYIHRLRRRLETADILIRTVRNVGYRLEVRQ